MRGEGRLRRYILDPSLRTIADRTRTEEGEQMLRPTGETTRNQRACPGSRQQHPDNCGQPVWRPHAHCHPCKDCGVDGDAIRFHNPGSLPQGITIEMLKIEHYSFLRNPLVAKIFCLAGFVERYGSGIGRIVDALAEAGLPEPEFLSDSFGFIVRMRKDLRFTESSLRAIDLNERQLQAMSFAGEPGAITTMHRLLRGYRRRSDTAIFSISSVVACWRQSV